MAEVNHAEAQKIAEGRLRIALGARQKAEAAVKRTPPPLPGPLPRRPWATRHGHEKFFDLT